MPVLKGRQMPGERRPLEAASQCSSESHPRKKILISSHSIFITPPRPSPMDALYKWNAILGETEQIRAQDA